MFPFNPGFPAGSSPVKSVQYFTVTFGTGTTATAGITSVNTGKSLISWLGFTNQGSAGFNSEQEIARMTLTNATTVTCTKAVGTAASVLVMGGVVVEYS